MGNTLNGFDKPDYNDNYDLPGDLQAAVDFAEKFAWQRGGPATERQSLAAGRRRAGSLWHETDTGLIWQDRGTTLGWKIIAGRVVGHVKRSATAATITPSYLDMSATTYWNAVTALGFEPYANGWTVPYTGRYLVSYEVRANGTFLAGVAVNQALSSNPTLQLEGTTVAVQTIASVSTSGPLQLNAGDVVRPYLLSAAGNLSWRVSEGFFAIELLGGV